MFKESRCVDFMGMPRPEMKEFKQDEKMAAVMPEHHHMPAMDGCCMNQPMPGMVCPPVYECPQERCCHREIVHEVPHVIPVNTRIINHHIYRHSFTPCFSSCEENVCSDVYEQPCSRRC